MIKTHVDGITQHVQAARGLGEFDRCLLVGITNPVSQVHVSGCAVRFPPRLWCHCRGAATTAPTERTFLTSLGSSTTTLLVTNLTSWAVFAGGSKAPTRRGSGSIEPSRSLCSHRLQHRQANTSKSRLFSTRRQHFQELRSQYLYFVCCLVRSWSLLVHFENGTAFSNAHTKNQTSAGCQGSLGNLALLG